MNTFTCKGFETLSTEQQQAIVRMVELACDHFGSTPTAVSSKDLLASVAEREALERGGQVAVSEACTHDWYQGAVRSCSKLRRDRGLANSQSILNTRLACDQPERPNEYKERVKRSRLLSRASEPCYYRGHNR